jgi:molybdopterin converting factor small subunit
MPIKPEEAVELLKFLEIDPEKIESIDKAKESFAGIYVARKHAASDEDIVNSIVGQRFGSLETKLKKSFKDVGVDFDDEFKGKKFEEQIELTASKLKTKFTELQELSGKGSDEKVNKLQAELEKHKQKIQDLSSLNENLSGEFEKVKLSSQSELKNYIIDNHKTKALSSVLTKATNMDDLKRKGFESYIAEKYELDIDEQKNPIVRMKENGKPVASKLKASAFATFDEILEAEAKELKLIASAPGAGNPIQTWKAPQPPAPAAGQAPVKRANPRFGGNAI